MFRAVKVSSKGSRQTTKKLPSLQLQYNTRKATRSSVRVPPPTTLQDVMKCSKMRQKKPRMYDRATGFTCIESVASSLKHVTVAFCE